MTDTFEQKTERNFRVKRRYDDLRRAGKHGHYESMFAVVREEVELAGQSEAQLRAALRGLYDYLIENDVDGLCEHAEPMMVAAAALGQSA